MRTEKFTKSLDELETDLIVAPLFSDEHPPKGVAGLVDWRLNGFLSRMILSNKVSGTPGESVLMPLHRRLPARRVLFLGLGSAASFSMDQVRAVAEQLGSVLGNLKTVDVALSLPPAVDEKKSGDTERVVCDVLGRAPLSSDLLLRWLAPTIVKPVDRVSSTQSSRSL